MFTIHSKPTCPWCDKAKALLSMRGYPYEEITYKTVEEIDNFKAKGFRQFPQIFDPQGKHIGGYEALEDHLDPDDF